MAQFTPPSDGKQLSSVAQCLRLEGNAKVALRKFDFLVRQALISAKSGLTPEELSEVERALTTVLMTVAADMAFVARRDINKDGLRDQAHALLDESLDWSAKKNSALWKSEEFTSLRIPKNDNDA